MKDFEIPEKNYVYLLKYFDGEVQNITMEDLKDLKKGKFKGKQVNKIDDSSYKLFKFIVTIKKKDAKKYAKMRWVYPEWTDDQKTKIEKLKEYFPEDYEDEEDDDSIVDDGGVEVRDIESVTKSVIPQRKAFIDWVNDVFYEEQLKSHPDDRLDEIKKTKIYQFFVKQYLSIEMPFRGLLVYHGLGTGKTATSVVTSEGLSKDMKIYTILPASLEENYIIEVKDWGDILF